jgi:hypothetical protein
MTNMKTYIAAIKNRAITTQPYGSGDGGEALGLLIARLYRTAVLVGALALFLYIAWGGINWITAGGDKGKVEAARNQITNGIIGMAVLVGSAAIAAFLSQLFGFELLNPTLLNTTN